MTSAMLPTTDLPRAADRTRADILAALVRLASDDVPTFGGAAAFQGMGTAPQTWVGSTGAADLDIWADETGADLLDSWLAAIPAARVQHADDPARLRHTSWAIETPSGPAIVDITRGSLAVGPIQLVTEDQARADLDTTGPHPRLSGVSGAADLLVRPLLRGKTPPRERLIEARTAWLAAPAAAQRDFIDRLRRQLGDVADGIGPVLDGADVEERTRGRIRRAYTASTLRGVGAAWRQRRVIVPAGRHEGIAGVRARGVLVVLVGTDGSGKSTLAQTVGDRLESQGIPVSHVYMGMARGNLPGVALARRLLGVPSPEESAARVATKAPAPARSEETTAPTDHPLLRRAAAWFYGAEYLYRYARDVRPRRYRDGRPAVVLSDRYVYDLADSPWPGSRAAAVARRLMPRPDVLLVPDAPDAVIHARKPERAAYEQAAQQAAFRALAAEHPARCASLLVDTSGVAEEFDPVAPAVAAIVAAMHSQPTSTREP